MEEGEDDEKQNKEEMQIKYDKNMNQFKKKLNFERNFCWSREP